MDLLQEISVFEYGIAIGNWYMWLNGAIERTIN